MASAKARTRRWAAMSLSDRPVWTFGAANSSLSRARMPTVTAADEALSSCSQNAAYSATIMVAQIRSAKAQVESGNPAMVMVREALSTRVTATGAARLTGDLGGYLPLPDVTSLI